MTEKREKYIRLFILESPNPLDILNGTAEGPGLKEISRLIGHESEVFPIKSKSDLYKIIKFICSIDEKTNDKNSKPSPDIFLHISAHGNENGLQIGGDFLEWNKLVKYIQPILKEDFNYSGNRILVLSACLAEKQGLTKHLNKILKNNVNLTPPKYIFTTVGKIPWASAAVGWAILYHLLPKADLDDKKTVQAILNKIAEINVGNINYFRWNDLKNKYFFYKPKVKK